jgi:hypothetical protein
VVLSRHLKDMSGGFRRTHHFAPRQRVSFPGGCRRKVGLQVGQVSHLNRAVHRYNLWWLLRDPGLRHGCKYPRLFTGQDDTKPLTTLVMLFTSAQVGISAYCTIRRPVHWLLAVQNGEPERITKSDLTIHHPADCYAVSKLPEPLIPSK